MITETEIRSALKDVHDPELGLDVVSLGLIYRVNVLDKGKKIDIDMTLTTPACPAGPYIVQQAKSRLMAMKEQYPELEEASVNLVWTPFWNPSMMSEDAREELGFF